MKKAQTLFMACTRVQWLDGHGCNYSEMLQRLVNPHGLLGRALLAQTKRAGA